MGGSPVSQCLPEADSMKVPAVLYNPCHWALGLTASGNWHLMPGQQWLEVRKVGGHMGAGFSHLVPWALGMKRSFCSHCHGP